jgi:hypothetical protein
LSDKYIKINLKQNALNNFSRTCQFLLFREFETESLDQERLSSLLNAIFSLKKSQTAFPKQILFSKITIPKKNRTTAKNRKSNQN